MHLKLKSSSQKIADIHRTRNLKVLLIICIEDVKLNGFLAITVIFVNTILYLQWE